MENKPVKLISLAVIFVMASPMLCFLESPVSEAADAPLWEFKQGDVRGYNAELSITDIEAMLSKKLDGAGGMSSNQILAKIILDEIFGSTEGEKTIKSMSADGFAIVTAIAEVERVTDSEIAVGIMAKAVLEVNAKASIKGLFPHAGNIGHVSEVMKDNDGRADVEMRTVDVASGVFAKISVDAHVVMTPVTYSFRTIDAKVSAEIYRSYAGGIKVTEVVSVSGKRSNVLSYENHSASASMKLVSVARMNFTGDGVNLFNGFKEGKWTSDVDASVDKMLFDVDIQYGGAMMAVFKDRVDPGLMFLRFAAVDESTSTDELRCTLDLVPFISSTKVLLTGESFRDEAGDLHMHNLIKFGNCNVGMARYTSYILKDMNADFTLKKGNLVPQPNLDVAINYIVAIYSAECLHTDFKSLENGEKESLEEVMGKLDQAAPVAPSDAPVSPLVEQEKTDATDPRNTVSMVMAVLAGLFALAIVVKRHFV